MWKLETYRASWRDSIALLSGTSLKMIILVSARTLLSLYKAFLGAWPLLIYAALPLLGLFIGAKNSTAYIAYLSQLYVAFVVTINILYYIGLVGSARPSVEYKDAWYWLCQPIFMGWAFFYFIYTCFMIYSPNFFEWELSVLLNWPVLIWLIYGEASFYTTHSLVSLIDLGTYFSAFVFALWLLFVFDIKPTLLAPFKAAIRTILMLLYNFPLYAFLSLAFLVTIKLMVFSEAFVAPVIPYYRQLENILFICVLMPWWISCMTTVYVKRIHEQGSLYYTK